MSEHKGASTVVNELAEEMGLTFGMTTAKRARLIAEEIVVSGDDETILELVSDGVAKHLGLLISRRRKHISDGTSAEAWSPADVSGPINMKPAPIVQTTLLDLPVVVPGIGQQTLGDSTPAQIRLARDAMRLPMKRLSRSVADLDHVLSIVAGLSEGETINNFIAHGLLDASLLKRSA